jgi:hypothetical protein
LVEKDAPRESLKFIEEWIGKLQPKEGVFQEHRVAAETSMNIVRLFVFSYIHWITHIVKQIKCSADQIPVLMFRASINGTADMAALNILRTVKESVDPHSFDWRGLFRAIEEEALKTFGTDKGLPVIAYDEYMILERLCTGCFFHDEELKLGNLEAKLHEMHHRKPGTGYKQTADLFYAFRKVMKEFLSRRWPQLVTGANASLWELGNYSSISPLRGSTLKWRKFHYFSKSDCTELLHHYFVLPMDKQHEIEACCEPFQGRPLFFCNHYLPLVFHKVMKERPKSSEELLPILKDCVEEAKSSAIECFRLPIENVLQSTNNVEQGLSLSDVAWQLYFHTALVGNSFRLKTTETFKELLSRGLLVLPKVESIDSLEDIEINISNEPLFFEALAKCMNLAIEWQPLSKDPVLELIFNQSHCAIAHNPSNDGIATEYVFLWFLYRGIAEKNPFNEIFRLISVHPLPSSFFLPFRKVSFIKGGFPDESHFEAAKDRTLIFFNIDEQAGPDVLILFEQLDGRKGVIAIQIKNRQPSSSLLKEALDSLNPGYIYSSKNQREHFHSKKPLSKEELNYQKKEREEFARLYTKYNIHWLRCIWNVGSFSKSIIKSAEKWNTKEKMEFPVALLSSNEKVFEKVSCNSCCWEEAPQLHQNQLGSHFSKGLL